jgi:hypothetical protein
VSPQDRTIQSNSSNHNLYQGSRSWDI